MSALIYDFIYVRLNAWRGITDSFTDIQSLYWKWKFRWKSLWNIWQSMRVFLWVFKEIIVANKICVNKYIHIYNKIPKFIWRLLVSKRKCIFFCLEFLSLTLAIHRKAEEGRKPSSCLSVTSISSTHRCIFFCNYTSKMCNSYYQLYGM